MQKKSPFFALVLWIISMGYYFPSSAQCPTNGAEPTLISAVTAPGYCFQEVPGGIGIGAGSRKIYSGFTAGAAYQFRMNLNGAPSNCVQVRWLDNANAALSGWSGINFSGWNGNATSLSAPGGADRLEVTINATGWNGSSALLNYRQTPPNAALPAGSNTWNVYAFSHTGYNFANITTLSAATHLYQGYYSDNTVDINTPLLWADQPSQAPGYQGCAPGVDNHTVVYKRTGFPCREYQIDLDGHDDGVLCYVNGSLVYSLDACCADRGIIWQGVLGATSTVEFRHMEGGGGSNLLVNFIEVDNFAVTASATPTALCEGGSVNLTSSTSGTAPNCLNTFNNNSVIPIPDNNATGIVSPITVSSTALANSVLNVNLNITHTFDGDLEVILRAPNGSEILLSNRRGGGGDNFSGTTFARFGIAVSTGAAPFTGTFSPDAPFTNLTGSANGTWNLVVRDRAGGDVGSLQNWSITLPTSCGTTTYSWSGNNYSSTGQNPTISPAAANQSGVFTVTATNGCPVTAGTANVSISADPTVNISGAANVCVGGTVTLTANVTGGTGTPSYQWRRNGSNVGGNSASYTTDNSLAAGSYSYDVIVTQTGSGCQGTSAAVNANVVAAPTVTISGAADVCAGNSVTLTANLSGGLGAASYQWRRNGSNVGGNSASYTTDNSLPAGSYTYDVVVTQTGVNCQATAAAVNANVNAVPAPVTVSASGTYCNNTTLSATGGSGGTIYYQGTVSGGTSTATPSASQNMTVSGTYYFRAQSAAGCWGPEGSATVVIQPLITYYADADGDGFGDPAVTTQACSTPAGYVTDNTDCDDTRNTVYPGAPEICDGLDNNCNGSTDEGVLNTYYADADGDGYGDPAVSAQACTAPVGYVSDNTDCDDTRNTVYPGAPEICDGLDNNCNGSTDEGVLNTYYADTDGDGYGDPAVSTQACTAPVGYVSNNTDCDDTNNSIYPGAFEICGNGIDEDCDGSDAICAGLVWNGSTGTDWATAANWTPNGIPNNCASDISIPLVANQPAITGADYSVGSMTVADGVIISVQNGFRLNVCGNVNISGSTGLDVNGGQLFFVGSTPQTVTGVLTADAATLNNTAGLTLAAAGSFSVVRSVSLQNGTLTSNDNLTLLSDATGTAYLDDFSTGFAGNVSGNINVQRYNPLGLAGFRQLGTPVQLPNISAVSNFTPSGTAGFVIPVPTCDPNYVAFNSPYGNWMQLVENGTVQYACHQSLFEVLTSGGMTSGRGYYLDVPGNSTLTFTGAPTTGSVSFGLTHANTAVTNGWNMVSNPYPSPLAWETANVPAGVDGIGKIWVTSGAYTGTFQDIDPNVPGTAVAIGQAFQVRVSTPGASVPFTVDNSDRTTAPPTYLFAGGPGMVLNIDILGNGFADLTKVRFIDGATPAMDAMFDSPKMLGNANQPMVYSVWNGKNYSTNSYAELNQVYTLPLGTKLATAGQYTLAFSNADQFPGSAFIYLEDTETQTWQDIRLNDTYVFTQNEGVNENRFLLHFYPPLQQQVTDASCTQPGRVVLTEEAPAAWNYRLADNQGTTVSQGTLDGSRTIDGLPAGQYVLSLTEQTSGYTTTEIVHVTGEVAITAQASVSSLTAETGQSLQFNAQTQGADAWHWDFGDSQTATEQNPVHAYNAGGTYHVILMASNTDCEVTSNLTVNVISTASIQDDWKDAGVKMWNDGNIVYLTFGETWAGKSVFSLYDMQGRKIYQHRLNDASGTLSIDCGVLAAGTYTAELSGNGKFLTRKTAMGIK